MAEERRPPPRQTLRRLLELSRSEWRRIALGTFFLAVGSAMQLAYPQMIRRILDQAVVAGTSATIDAAAIGMGIMFAIQGLAMAGRAYCFSVAGERIVAGLRERVYRHLVSQEIAFFDERKTGELTSRLASDATVLQSAVAANVSMGLRNLVAAAGGLALLFYTSPLLTLIMLAVVPPVALGAVIYGKRVSKLARQTQDALAASNQVAEESLAGIRTVRSFAAEEAEAARYNGKVEEAFEIARRRSRASAVFSGAATIAGYGAVAVVLWYGGRLVQAGGMSVGALTSFVLYTLVVAFALGSLADLWTDFMRAGGAAQRIFELLERTPQIPLRGGAQPERAIGGVVLSGVEFAYPSRPDAPVLRGLDLVLRPGERVALVGSSGAGKSTVAALLGRQYDPQAGRITFDGHELTSLDPGWLRRQIGVVAQEPVLFSTSIEANIRYGRPEARDAEVIEAARAANAHQFVSAFPEGYRTVVGERGVQLSGGQRQRVAIARALLKDPRLLILDEATSALDAESEHLVVEALERLMEGRTTLVIAHRLSTVKSADRVAVIEEGRIAQIGPHAALLAEDGLYRRLVERQLAG